MLYGRRSGSHERTPRLITLKLHPWLYLKHPIVPYQERSKSRFSRAGWLCHQGRIFPAHPSDTSHQQPSDTHHDNRIHPNPHQQKPPAHRLCWPGTADRSHSPRRKPHRARTSRHTKPPKSSFPHRRCTWRHSHFRRCLCMGSPLHTHRLRSPQGMLPG